MTEWHGYDHEVQRLQDVERVLAAAGDAATRRADGYLREAIGLRRRLVDLEDRYERLSVANAEHLAMLIRVRLWCEAMGGPVEIDADPLPHIQAIHNREVPS